MRPSIDTTSPPTAGIVAIGLTDFYTNLVYGAVILISVSIHAVLQRRFER